MIVGPQCRHPDGDLFCFNDPIPAGSIDEPEENSSKTMPATEPSESRFKTTGQRPGMFTPGAGGRIPTEGYDPAVIERA